MLSFNFMTSGSNLSLFKCSSEHVRVISCVKLHNAVCHVLDRFSTHFLLQFLRAKGEYYALCSIHFSGLEVLKKKPHNLWWRNVSLMDGFKSKPRVLRMLFLCGHTLLVFFCFYRKDSQFLLQSLSKPICGVS